MGNEGMEETNWRHIAAVLADALKTHRADMHNSSNRPCSTCRNSEKALARYSEAVAANQEGSETAE